MAKKQKRGSTHSGHSKRFRFFTGALAVVLAIAVLVNLGSSLTGYAPAGSGDSDGGSDSGTETTSSRPRSLPLYDLTIEILNVSLPETDGTAGITALKITGNSEDALIFQPAAVLPRVTANIFYIGIGNTNARGAYYVGRIFYADDLNNWADQAFPTPGNLIFNTSATRGTVTPVQLRISTWSLSNRAGGRINIIDGHNSTTNQGGTWEIEYGYHRLGFIPSGYSTSENYRSVNYNYYISTTGQPMISPSTLGSNYHYRAIVKRQFQSPAATRITELTRTKIRLKQAPAYVALGSNHISGFAFTCIDTDPANDPYRAGAINIRTPGISSNGLYIPSRDSCVYGSVWNGEIRNAYRQEVICNANGLPGYAGGTACQTPACNQLNTTCAPATTTFSCSDNDEADDVSVPGSVTIAPSTGGTSWRIIDECPRIPVSGGAYNASIRQFNCIGTGIGGLGNTTINCPSSMVCGNSTTTLGIAVCNPN